MGKGVGMGGGEIEISHVGGGMGYIWWYGIGCMGLLWRRDVNSLLSTTVVILGPSFVLIERGRSLGHGWWRLDWIIIVIGVGVRRVCGCGLVWVGCLVWSTYCLDCAHCGQLMPFGSIQYPRMLLGQRIRSWTLLPSLPSCIICTYWAWTHVVRRRKHWMIQPPPQSCTS